MSIKKIIAIGSAKGGVGKSTITAALASSLSKDYKVVRDIYDDLDWGYIEYGEFSASSYTDINWGYAEFDEFGTDIYDDVKYAT